MRTNYICDGQMDMFDFIPKNNSMAREKCLYNENNPCNIINAHDVARELGFDCQYGCCVSCKYNKECGAACRYSVDNRVKPRFTRKTCASTLKECDCYCGTDSTTDKCCMSCTEECEHRCEHSLDQPKVFDKTKAGTTESWVHNKNCTNIVIMTENVILRGTGFVGGKARVIDLYKQDISSKERTKLIKKEYGLGGAGWPLKGYGLHGYDSFHSDGIQIQYREADGEHEKLIPWAKVEKIISKLITEGKYEASQ